MPHPFLAALVLFSALLTTQVTVAKPSLAPPSYVGPVLLDGQTLDEVWIFPRPEKVQFSIEATPLLEALRPTLKNENYQNLTRRVSPQGTLSLVDLEAVGFNVTHNEQTLELRLELPLKYRKVNDLDLTGSNDGLRPLLRPSAHSGYLNLRTQQNYQYGNAVEDKKMPLTGNLEFVENIRGFVFETSANYQEQSEYPWQRQHTRLRKDDEDRMIRYTLGDLALNTQGFQRSPEIAGLSLVREFGIQPYKTLRPLSSSEIVIERNSLVEVYVNGFLYSQIRVSPGVFNIRDYPLTNGQNNVQLKIKDDLGQEETYDFSILLENSLLGENIHEFSYAVGSPWTSSAGDRRYDNQYQVTSVFHRWGVLPQLTLGVNYQNYLTQSLSGLEISGASRGGYLSVDVGYSDRSQQRGTAQRWRYRSLDRMAGVDLPFVLSLEAEQRDDLFSPLTVNETLATSFRRRYDGQLNFRLGQQWLWGLGSTSTQYKNELERSYRSNLVIPLATRARLELSYNKVVDKSPEERYFVSFFWTEKQGLYSASSYYDSNLATKNLSLNRNNRYKYDDVRLSANLQNNDFGTTGAINAEYLKQPLSLRLEHYGSRQFENESHLTGLGLNTAIAWVGDQWAWTQPINDSFVLLTAPGLPPKNQILINPVDDVGEAQLGPREVTVLRDQSAYYKSAINIDATTLPPGYLIDHEYYLTHPTYRSGILIDLNLKSFVMVTGQLVDVEGRPLSHLTGDVFNEAGQLVDNNFFTNSQGRFVIEGLLPGKYTVKTSKLSLNQFSFTVPSRTDSSSLLSLPPITLVRMQP